jgi:hypothetical protein
MELRRAVASKPLLFRKIADRCVHLLPNEEERLRYRYALQQFIVEGSEEGAFFARYAAIYYGAVGSSDERRFLATHGHSDCLIENGDIVVRESWENMSEHQYRESNTLDDINFLRCILVLQSLRLSDDLSGTSRNMLATMAMRARKSKDRFVSQLASDVLHSISG